MGVSDHLICLLRNLSAGQEATEPDMGQPNGSELGKEYNKGVYCDPAYLTSMQSTSCEMQYWMKLKLESRLLQETSTTSDMQMIYHSNGRKWRGTEEPLDEGERGEWISWLETQHSKTNIMFSGPITLWQIEWEKVEAVSDFVFLGSKITRDGADCSHNTKSHLLLGMKPMINLDSVLKSRDITLPTKLCMVKAVVFQVINV